MERIEAVVGVTGMNATDNPAPGVAVARSLKHEPSFGGKVIGLGYDPLDPGFYAEGLLDGGGILPYPSAGRDALLDQLRKVRSVFGLEVLMPTLDSELRAIAALGPELAQEGIRTYVPTTESIERASKANLHRLGQEPGVRVPDSEPVLTPEAIPQLVKRFGLPVMIKGAYYGAVLAHSEADAMLAFHRYVATWGLPVVVQKFVPGEEYNVAAIGDGRGGLVGAVAMRKMALTDKGKGWSGVTVDNPRLLALSEAMVAALRWRGPLEVEILRHGESDELYAVEINPRFPAWVHLSTGAGQNLPYACALLALGLSPPRPMPPYRPGTMFVRISIDQISDLSTFEQLTASGIMQPRRLVP